MSLQLTKLSETATKITLGWAPVPGAIGYRFQSATQAPKWSHTFDASRSQVTFAKAAWYKVEALAVEAAGEYPSAAPSPPVGDKLRYAPPTLTSPVAFDLTNANRLSGFLRNGQGRDLKITCREVLTGPVDEMIGWRNVVWIGGEFASISTGERGHIVPRDIRGTFHLEGVKYRSVGDTDCIAARWGEPSTVIQIQNCDLQVTHAGTSSHADVFQTQEARIKSLRFHRCTIHSNYQGVFVSNEFSSDGTSQVEEMRMSRVNFRTVNGQDAIWLFKAIPSRTGLLPGPWYLEDVWAPTERVYPTTAFIDWQGNSYAYGCNRKTDAQGAYLEWTPNCEINGVLRIGPHADFCAADAGLGYVSPGYV